MFLAYLLLGSFSGIAAFVTSLVMGQTFASAATAYIAVSVIVALGLMITYALISFIRERAETRRREGRGTRGILILPELEILG